MELASATGRMRKLIIATILAMAFVLPVRADDGLTGAVADAYFPRSADAGLHDIAHQRVMEISSCNSCLDHDGMRDGTAEVLGYNSGYAQPVAAVIDSWSGSAIHDGILSNASFGRIGCAHRAVGDRHWFVCVLATGGSSGRSSSGGALTLPDTAMPR